MTANPKQSATPWPYVLVALSSLFWAGNHVLGRAIAGEVPPFAISAIRWAVPTLILLPFAWPHLKRDLPALKGHWFTVVALAATGAGLFGILQYVGLQYTSAINVSVLNSLSPVLIAVAGALLFRDQLTWVQALGVAISLAGVLAIVTRGDIAELIKLNFNWGDLIIIFNMIVFGVYTTCLRLRPQIHWLTYMFILAAVSTGVSVPFFAWEHASGYTLKATTLTFFALAYASIFPSLLANMCWNRGVEVIGPNRTGAMMHLVAIFSPVLAGFFIGERLMGYHFIGFGLILLGVWMAAKPAASATVKQQPQAQSANDAR